MTDRIGPKAFSERARFAEIVRELNVLAEEASSLFFQAEREHLTSNAQAARRSSPRTQKVLLKAAKQAYSLRRFRSNLFKGDDLFGEPAWDILLDLYIADLQGTKLSITDACIGSAVPNTTALRWIAILQQSGLATRQGDPRDGRRAYLQLTDQGAHLMQAYFERVLDMSEE